MTDDLPKKGLLPLLTGDGILAFSLYLAGAEMPEDMWCVNYYTFDMLRSLGYRGIPPKEAALLAAKAGKRGTVRFLFKQRDGKLMGWFADQESRLETAEGKASDMLRDLFEDFKSGARDYPEIVVRVACLILKMRTKFMNGWKDQMPLLCIDGEKAKRTEGEGGSFTMELGHFKFISANASKEIEQHLGL